MILDQTTRTLEIILAGAVTTNQLVVTGSYADITNTTFVGAPVLSHTNGSTPVTIVPAPAAGVVRKITEIAVYNADTAPAVVTIRINDNGTTYNKTSLNVPAGYTLQYMSDTGFSILTASGTIQTGVVGPQGATGAVGPTGAASTVPGSGVVASGSTFVDFGSGSSDASVSVNSINSWTIAQAWLLVTNSSNNLADNHVVEDLAAYVTQINPGNSFVIRVKCNSGLANGQYNVAWCVN